MKFILKIFICTIFYNSIIFGQTTHFTFTSSTGNNATVVILTSANPNINSVALSNGDEIGAFTTSGLCVGAVVWENANTTITVWGDDDQTGEVDGITPGELIRFKVWDQSENIEYSNVNVTFDSNPPFILSGLYSVNGLYSLTSLSAIPPSEPTITVSVTSLPDFGDVIINTSSASKSYTVSGSDLTANILVTVPSGFEVSIDNSTFNSLVTLSQSGGIVSNDTVYVRFSPNSVISYSGNITHVSSGATSKNVSVSGNGIEIPTLNVTPSNQDVDYGADSTTFIVTSNLDWTVSEHINWLMVFPNSGSDNDTLIVTYEENTIVSERVGTITVIGGGITRQVTVTQSAAPFTLIVSPLERMVSHTADSTTFTVISNTSWSASDDADWLTVLPNSGSNNDTLTATYTENTTTSQRVGTIIVTGGGILDSVKVIQEGSTGIEDLKSINNIPTAYKLFDNYPNPFNPSTYIEFGIPEESTTQLKVYDIIGNEIATLLENETLHAGKYRYELKADKLTSGIYIYILKSQSNISNESFRALKKMILLK